MSKKNALFMVTIMLTMLLFVKNDVIAANVIDSRTEGTITWTLYDDGNLDITGTGDFNISSFKDYKKSIRSVSIGEGITRITTSFSDCYNMEKITLPETLTYIDASVFTRTVLKDITIPNSVKEIGWFAFSGSKLQSVKILNPDVKLVAQTFEGCNELTSVTIPDKLLNNIDADDIFNGTPWLLNRKGSISGVFGNFKFTLDKDGTLTLSGSGTIGKILDSGILSPYSGFIKTVIISESTKKIGYFDNFIRGTSAEKVINKSSAQIKLSSISCYGYSWCKNNKKHTLITKMKKGTAVKTYGYKITDSYNKTVEYIGLPSDKESSSISVEKEIDIDAVTYKVTSIAKKALYKNKNAERLTIPKTVTSIGARAFYGCSKLRSVTINANDELKIDKDAFKGISKDAVITVKGVKGKQKKDIIKEIQKQTNAKVK